MNFLVSAFSIFAVLTVAHIGYQAYRMFLRRPASYPTAKYIARIQRSHPRTAHLVCLGDSITQGDIGASYVSLLEKRFLPESWTIMNAGINGDLSSNALARIEDVIAAQPDCITILIGTNDIHATMSVENHEVYVRLGKTKEPASFVSYKANVAEILRRLKTETTARIALISIPLMSENLDHEANKRGETYNDYLREMATQRKVDYLPLRERQRGYLETTARKGSQPYEKTTRLMNQAVIWSFLGMSWDQIAERIGSQITIDNLHSNSRTARMIADLIEGFVHQNGVR